MTDTAGWAPWSQRNGDRIIAYLIRDKFISTLLFGGVALLSKSIVEAMLEAARIFNPNIAQPAESTFEMADWAGLMLLGIAILTKLRLGRRESAAKRKDATLHLLANFQSMTPGEKQVRFAELYDILPETDRIDALLNHPSNPVGVARMYPQGALHVIWDGTWFALRTSNAWHTTKQLALLTLFLISVVMAVGSMVGGTILVWFASASNQKLLGQLTIAEGILMAFAAKAYFNDVMQFAAARNLTRSRP